MTNEIINLYLDDLRDCPDGYIIARNVKEAIHYIKNFKIHIIQSFTYINIYLNITINQFNIELGNITFG